jgi:hypothetical protein
MGAGYDIGRFGEDCGTLRGVVADAGDCGQPPDPHSIIPANWVAIEAATVPRIELEPHISYINR